MSFLDSILNLVALLLWIDWRSEKLQVKNPRGGVTLADSLKTTERTVLRPWLSLGAWAALLLFRAFFYWNVGTAASWTPVMDLFVISLAWRSDLLLPMFVFSLVSFALTLFGWVTCLLLLSAVQPRAAEENPFQRFIRLQLGWLDRLPVAVKLLFPFLLAFVAWLALFPLLVEFRMLPAGRTNAQIFRMAAILGLAAYFIWKWFLIAVFFLHLLNTYIYLGNHRFWDYVTQTARRLLWPVRFLRIGRLDLAPAAAIALLILAVDYGLEPLVRKLYEQYAL